MNLKKSEEDATQQQNIKSYPLASKFYLYLLQNLSGIIFRFREHQITLSADIEAMFLQIAVPSDESRCVRFFCLEDLEQKNEGLRVHTTRFWGAKLAHLCKLRFAPIGER